MKILHAASGLSVDGRFGGAAQVVVDLAQAQASRGDAVAVVAPVFGSRSHRRQLTDAGFHLIALRAIHPFKRLGFGTILPTNVSHTTIRRLRSADIVHLHLARDSFTSLIGFLAIVLQKRLVVQTHGMIDEPSNRLARLVDYLLTAPILRYADIALTLTEAEDDHVRRVAPATAISRFPNGVTGTHHAGWDISTRDTVLFLSRLHPRKGAVEFSESAVALEGLHSHLGWLLVGPDEGDGRRVNEIVARSRVKYLGPVDHDTALTLMARSYLYVLPATNEPFGLALVEAMSLGTPVVCHSTAELAALIAEYGAGLTFGPGGQYVSLTEAIAAALADPAEQATRSTQAMRLVQANFTIDRITTSLSAIYKSVLRTPAVKKPI